MSTSKQIPNQPNSQIYTTPGSPSHTSQTMRSPTAAPVPSLHLLPLELRREIYGYVALDEESWIGVPSALDARLARLASENAKESHLGENMSLNEFVRRYVTGCLEDEQTHRPRPTAFVKTTSGLVETCSQIRNEFREAVWWNCVDNLHLDEYVEVLVRNFCVEDFKAFMHSLSIREMMRLSEKRREPNRNKLRIHLDLSRTFPLWTPSIETPDFLVANIVCVGNVLAALLERVGLAAITPRRLLELRDIAQKARKWKCNMKTAVMVRGAYAILEPIREWMAFVRSTGLRADYVVDTPTPREKMEVFEHAMRDKRLYARDEAWRSVFNAVVKSCGRESAYDWTLEANARSQVSVPRKAAPKKRISLTEKVEVTAEYVFETMERCKNLNGVPKEIMEGGRDV